MSDEADNCVHGWGEAELCETPLGNVSSPVCRYCGAVKLFGDQWAHLRKPRPLASVHQAKLERIIDSLKEPEAIDPRPIATNIPRAGVPVHPFQVQFFTNV